MNHPKDRLYRCGERGHKGHRDGKAAFMMIALWNKGSKQSKKSTREDIPVRVRAPVITTAWKRTRQMRGPERPRLKCAPLDDAVRGDLPFNGEIFGVAHNA